MLRRGICVLAITAMVCGAQGAQAADPGWQEPLELGSGSGWHGSKLVANGPDGFLYLWHEEHAGEPVVTLHVTRVPASGSSATEETLGSSSGVADIASNGDGAAVAGWSDWSSDSCCEIKLAAKDPGEPFGDPLDVPGTSFGSSPLVAMNQSGDAVLVYRDQEEVDGTIQYRLWAVFRAKDGAFTAPELIGQSELGVLERTLDLGMTGAGEAVLAWARGDGVAYTAMGTASGFGDPVRMSAPGNLTEHPSLAVSESGGAVITWPELVTLPTTMVDRHYVAFRRPGEAFGLPKLITAVGRWTMDAAVADDGRGLISYHDADWYPVVRPIDTTTSTFGSPVRVPSGHGVGVAVSPAGKAIWMNSQQAAWGNVDGAFGAPQTFGCPGEPGYVSEVAFMPDGTAGLVGSRPLDSTYETFRTELLRSDPAIPPTTRVCYPPPPVFPDSLSARVALRIPARLYGGRGAVVPVTTVSTVAGRLMLQGKARAGGVSGRLKGAGSRQIAAGLIRSDLRIPREVLRKLRQGNVRRGSVTVRVTLDHARGTTAASESARLKP
jgi:hypothetical protein